VVDLFEEVFERWMLGWSSKVASAFGIGDVY
jgi:hypothetical protein